MRLSEVQHQPRAISIIRRALRSGRTHHAYLFDGPEGVGKELAARALAARSLCHSTRIAADADACGECPSCQAFTAGSHPDFHLIHRGLYKQHPDARIRAGKGLSLAIDVIRTFLIEPAALTSSLGRGRVFVIRDAERMQPPAQNALLKTIEEPPGQSRLILVSSAAGGLLETIRSRCQRVTFDRLPPEFVERRLVEQSGCDPAAAHTLAGLSGGRLGAALEWQRIGLLRSLDDVAAAVVQVAESGVEAFAKRLIETAEAQIERGRRKPNGNTDVEEEAIDAGDNDEDAASSGEAAASGGKAPATDELREALRLMLTLVAALLRDGLLAQTAGSQRLHVLTQHSAATAQLARTTSAETLADAIAGVAQAEVLLERNVAPQLACERLALAITGDVPIV